MKTLRWRIIKTSRFDDVKLSLLKSHEPEAAVIDAGLVIITPFLSGLSPK
jgi:hypothetical protein